MWVGEWGRSVERSLRHLVVRAGHVAPFGPESSLVHCETQAAERGVGREGREGREGRKRRKGRFRG